MRVLNSLFRIQPRVAKRWASTMPPHDRFLFDLNGYLVIRNVFSPEQVAGMNNAVDDRVHLCNRRDGALRNAKAGSGMSAVGPRMDLGGMLGWDGPGSEGFRSVLAHPKLLPYLHGLCGVGYRMDHLPLMVVQDTDSEGFMLHGGPISGSDGFPSREADRFNPELQYRCIQGQQWNSLLAVAVQLVEAKPGDGGFCVVRGSHKLNFSVPPDMADGDHAAFQKEHVYQPETKPGDVVIFSEATVHGALPWRAAHQRRVALYRFAPANMCYGRAYTENFGLSQEQLAAMRPEQKAVLEPPYSRRLDRPALTTTPEGDDVALVDDGPGRAQVKMQHDHQTFGTRYF